MKKALYVLLVAIMIFSTISTALANPVYYQVVGDSMNPELQDGDWIEIVSEDYQDGDMVVAQKKDGTKIVKRLMGDRLVSVGNGTSYFINEVTILGAVHYTPLSMEELEYSGFSWESILGEGVTIVQVAGGAFHTLALTNTGEVYAWGRNRYGQLGDGTETDRHTPVKVSAGALIENMGITSISAGDTHSLVIKEGEVYAWGWNIQGQLGDGTTIDRNTPVKISNGAMTNSDITSISGGYMHSLAIRNGEVYAWGLNEQRQLGDGTTIDRNTPIKVSDGAMVNSGITSISAGTTHSLVIKEGEVYAWGLNSSGQLGDGTTTRSGTPIKVSDGTMVNSGITSISAGGFYSLAMKNGEVYAWGNNFFSQLGDGTTINRNTPVKVSDGEMVNSGVSSISTGGFHSFAIKNGEVFAWGSNDYGELGDGTLTTRSTPVKSLELPMTPTPPTITSQPTGATVNQGAPSPTLSVGASVTDGGTLSYQWYSNSTNSNTGGTAISGATIASYEVPTNTLGTVYYYVVITNTKSGANENQTASVTSAVVEVTVNELVNAEPPTITSQPTGSTLSQGSPSPTFSVGASVYDGGNLSYQWYSNSTNSNTGGTAINGAISASYEAPTNIVGTVFYYVVITNRNSEVNGNQTASVTSNVATVTVNTVNSRGTGSPGGSTSGSTGSGSSTPTNSFLIDHVAGGIVRFEGVEIIFPAGVFSRNFHVEVNRVDKIKEEWQPKDSEIVSDIYQITKNQDGNFNKPVTIKIPFNIGINDKNKYNIALFWLDEGTGQWIQLDNSKVDWHQGMVSGETYHFTKFAVLATKKQTMEFSDLAGNWAQDSIQRLVGLEAIQGYPDHTFRPNNLITRAEFISILVRALGIEQSGRKEFSDSTNHWGKEMIATAYEQGMIRGHNETVFGPDDPITREQMAAIIVNAFDIPQGEGKLFKDGQNISPWAREAIQKASSQGILVGYEEGTFRPKSHATRAEAVTVIVRALEWK